MQFFLRTIPRAAVCALALSLATSAAAQQGPGASGPGGGATAVGIVTLQTQDVPFTITVPGRAVAYQQVDIRPRVGGMISEIVYQSGRPVKAGDVLFRIEDDTYQADVDAAQASVDLSQASVEDAQQTVDRYTRLLGTGITQEELGTAQVALKQAQADLSSAKAALAVAQLDLERTQITSPIDGFPSVPDVSVGTLVTAAQTDALTTVTQSNPIYVDVAESSRRIGEIRNQIEAGQLQRGERLQAALVLETGETYAGEGEMISPGATVSTTTGTREMRLQFANEEHRIVPGQFLRVDMTLGSMEAVLVPQGATSRSATGALTAFVAMDGKAEQRTLTEEGSYQNSWVVTDGVVAGESLIVDGLKTLLNGATITTTPVSIDENGVVSDTATNGN
ncbi:efflux RND transporter periplasmic adaptor subunit [Citreicella sp. C3M06]|uniref:efflux RND transporter periplasmic adaptor subunit n=1 Tax=Citreicella sp. C3M06 TaxID=2841564 RepID=UPI001C085CDB|nr:efflux RND transporter periplasmic adaptor subunit [Citreicella sp. C3M06]MBU2962487.1 efflux RND transporter periplasmic adaptor subunit [Citreicella sp. C3M06]